MDLPIRVKKPAVLTAPVRETLPTVDAASAACAHGVGAEGVSVAASCYRCDGVLSGVA